MTYRQKRRYLQITLFPLALFVVGLMLTLGPGVVPLICAWHYGFSIQSVVAYVIYLGLLSAPAWKFLLNDCWIDWIMKERRYAHIEKSPYPPPKPSRPFGTNWQAKSWSGRRVQRRTGGMRR